MCHTEIIEIDLPVSLRGAFETAVGRQAISVHEASRRLVCGLSGLTDADLRSLPEPPREGQHRRLELRLKWEYSDQLSEASRICRLTFSSIFRRILYAILITRTIHFFSCGEEQRICLKITQFHVEFADDFESDGPRPLLSRQHRE
jgi:hypothetical protein